MWSLYHAAGRIFAPLSHQAAKLQLFPQPHPSSWAERVTWLCKTVLGCLMRRKELQRMVSAGPWKISFLWQVTSNPKPAMCEHLLTGLTLCMWWLIKIRYFTGVCTHRHTKEKVLVPSHTFSLAPVWKLVCSDWNKDHTIFPLDNGREEQKSGLWQAQYFIPSLAHSADFVIKLPHLKTPFLQVWKWAAPASQTCEMSSYQNCFKRDRTDCHLPTGWEMRAAAFLQRWPWTSLSLPKIYLSWSLRC